MSDYTLGMDAVLYYSTTNLSGEDTVETVSWIELDNAKDVTLSLEKGTTDVTTRANNGWRAMAGTLKEGSVEFEMQWQTGDAGFEAIKDAFLDNEDIAIFVADGDIDTLETQGLAANFSVTNFSRNEPLEEAITVNVTLEPASQISWHEVEAT